MGVHFNSADKEKLYHGAMTTNLGRYFVAHVEGLSRDAQDYRTAPYQHNKMYHDKLEDSFAKSQSSSVGLSWVGDKGYLGVAYGERKDKYGLPAHSHVYDDYYIDLLSRTSTIRNSNPVLRQYYKGYLKYYPFLADEIDINYSNPGVHCKTGTYGLHDTLCIHKHNHNSANQGTQAHTNAHHHDGEKPHIDLETKHYDIRGEWNVPFLGLDKIKLTASRADYQHDEKTGDSVENAFANRGENVRLELFHRPIGRLTGIFGVQMLSQKQHANDKTQIKAQHQRVKTYCMTIR